MQYRPDAPSLLEAIADFLMKDVLPAVKEHDALAYKTLVSWNMLGVVSRELKSAEPLLNDEIARLLSHFKETRALPESIGEKLELSRELNGRLAEEIRSRSGNNAAQKELVKKALVENLSISNPRFGTE
ncbi:MAG TPA: DUF6285 domain-containing protein [Leptospiraceae bacterium]|nr:DUF6285 domain-containing protein [Leptospiraceae bacterium]